MPITFDSKLAEDECESELVFSADSALLEEKNGGRSYKFPRMEMKRPISVRLWLLHGGALVLYTGLFCVALWTSKDKGSYRHTNLVACK